MFETKKHGLQKVSGVKVDARNSTARARCAAAYSLLLTLMKVFVPVLFRLKTRRWTSARMYGNADPMGRREFR